jgi:hypothetical protein
MPTPETIQPEAPVIQERAEEFPEKIQQIQGVKIVPKTFQSQVKNNNGQPVIQTPPTQVITVQPPYDDTTLTKQSKGSITSSLTWLSAFWIRVIKKAIYFGWQVVGGNK